MTTTTLPTDLADPKEAAAALGVSHWTVLRWLRTGYLRGYLLGPKRYKVSMAEALRALRPIELAPEGEAPRTPAQERRAAAAAAERLRGKGYGPKGR